MSKVIADKLASLRRRILALSATTATAQWLVTALTVIVLLMVIDRLADLPRSLRIIFALALALGSLAWLAIKALRPWLTPPTDEVLAKLIERDQPGLRQRLISTVQFARDPTQSELIEKLATETETLLAPADLSTAAPANRTIHWAGAAFAAMLLLSLLLLATGPTPPIHFLRALGSAHTLPRQTQITLLTPTTIIARGDPVTVTVEVAGKMPVSGELHTSPRTSGENGKRLPLPATTQPGLFSATLLNPPASFTYRAHLGDNISEEGTVTIADRPALANIEFEVTPPAYTRLPTTRKYPGDLTFLEGSRLHIRARSTKSLSLKSEITAGSTTLPTTRSAADTLEASFIPTIDTPAITLNLTDTDNLSAKNLPEYRLTLTPDRPPTLKLIAPTRAEDVVTRRATIRVAFEAVDDIRLASIKIKYEIKNEFATSIAAGETPLDFPSTAALKAQYRFPLATLPLTEGHTLDWWLEATDDNKGTTTSDHFTLKIATEAEVKAALQQRLQSTLSGLEDAQGAQESLTQDLYQLLQAKPPTP